MIDFNQCEAHEVISTPNCPICLLYERDRLQSELTAARDEAERLRARVAELELEQKVFSAPVEVDRSWAEAQILRKQAEAVEAFSSEQGSPLCMEGRHLISLAQSYAQRLRQQADDLKNV